MRQRFRLASTHVGDDPSWYPTVAVQLETDRMMTSERRMVVDTGAAGILLPWSLARELNIASNTLLAPTTRFDGVGGAGLAHRVVLTLRVGRVFRLEAVPVFFVEGTETIAGYDGLLGQFGFFDRLSYAQSPGPYEPWFSLDDGASEPR